MLIQVTVMEYLVIMLKQDYASDLTCDLRLLTLYLSLTNFPLWSINVDVLLISFSKVFRVPWIRDCLA